MVIPEPTEEPEQMAGDGLGSGGDDGSMVEGSDLSDADGSAPQGLAEGDGGADYLCDLWRC